MEYIQLPPLPKNMSSEVVKIIWLYVQLDSRKQKIIYNFLSQCVNGDIKKIDEPEILTQLKDGDNVNKNIEKFVNQMVKLLEILIIQACETAGLLYQNYCIDGRSVMEISKEFDIDEEFLMLMIQYYDKRHSE